MDAHRQRQENPSGLDPAERPAAGGTASRGLHGAAAAAADAAASLRGASGRRTIRLIALDLDDTVLLPDKSISPRTKQAIRAAALQGRHIVLASARPLRSIAEYAQQLGIEGYCIGLNGAVVATLPGLEQVRVKYLEPELVRRILDLDRKIQAPNVFLEHPVGFACAHDGPDAAAYTYMAHSRALYIGDLYQYDHTAVCKVVFRLDNTPFPALAVLQEHLGDAVSYVIWEGPWSFVEVLPAGTSKADALQWLAARLGIRRDEVLAVGDERNDIEMVMWAGIGVAMGNAHPELKAVADWVTAPCTEDGCALAIERFAHDAPPPGA